MSDLLGKIQQLIVLLLINHLLFESLAKEMDNFAVLRRLGGEHVDLVLSFNQNLKRGDKLQRLSIYLKRNDLISTLRLQLYALSLSQSKRLLHSNLNLPHMQHITKPNHLNQPITERRIPQPIPRIASPKPSNPTSPIVDIQQNDALELFNVYLSFVD